MRVIGSEKYGGQCPGPRQRSDTQNLLGNTLLAVIATVPRHLRRGTEMNGT